MVGEMSKLLKAAKIVVIGGGTGTYSVLSGLKEYTRNITAVVSMTDSGGSAKKERDEWGLLPSSDIRKSLIALADVSKQNILLLRRLFQYRYNQGEGVTGMTFGNLFLVALTDLLGSQEKAIKKAGVILRIKGRVLPVTLDKVNLLARYTDGTTIIGEHFIDEPDHDGKLAITSLETRPKAMINPAVKEAILQSDIIIIGPGGFYTTIIANLVVKGVVDAIRKSQAKKIFILNLMTEYGQTFKFSASKFILELNKYFPTEHLDYVLMNNAPLPAKILKYYKEFQAEAVIDDFPTDTPFRVIRSDLLSNKVVRKEKGDKLKRSLLRHDSQKIAELCINVLGLI